MKVPFNVAYHYVHANNGAIPHFRAYHTLLAIKSNVHFLSNQYLIINYSQSKHALSASVRTVLWIYFAASRRNCGLLPWAWRHRSSCKGNPRLLLLAFQFISGGLVWKVCRLFPAAPPCVPQSQVQRLYSWGCSDVRAIKCGWGDAFCYVHGQFLWLVMTFTGRFGPCDVLEYMRYPLETMFEWGIKPKIAVHA